MMKTLDLQDIDAVIFDLDGVVTRTARQHAAAWRQLFDTFLAERPERSGEDLRPFDLGTDYPRHLDGKPRYDGVRDFLRSRGIQLAEGTPDDSPERETVCGLGNRKNQLFLQLIAREGVSAYPSTLELIRRLQAAGIGTAVISASRNARQVLEAAGIGNLFPVRVDGTDAARLGLAGKPAPDVFLEAAARLGSRPPRTAVVEDALAGVQAGRGGGFGLVVGVDRGGQADRLSQAADLVVTDLGELQLETDGPARSSAELPSALERFEDIAAILGHKPAAIFLDYDGTLTPIVERPEQALLSPAMRSTLNRLSRHATLVILSGRDRQNVERLVGLDQVVYAGSHGFDINGPGKMQREVPEGRAALPALEQAEQRLGERLAGIEGGQVERKRFAIAVHYRRVGRDRVPEIEAAVEAVARQHPELRTTGGKEIFELRPAVSWDKGRALAWLLEELGYAGGRGVAIYLGDDLTDEDALRQIAPDGIGILVRDEVRATHARYALENPEEVRRFLQRLADRLGGEGAP